MAAVEKHTILVVDDEPSLRRLLKLLIEKSGYKVITANGGDEAFELLGNVNVDLVLSDVRMADGDGFQLLSQIIDGGLGLPVVLMTGYSDVSEEEAIRRGAKTVFKKPLKSKEVIAYITKILAE